MHGRAVIPDHQVIELPVMIPDKLWLSGVFYQVPEQEPGLGHLPVNNMCCMRGQVK